jgi:hypothetical protein
MPGADNGRVSAFNVVTTERPEPCPRCGSTELRLQFKFGDCWQTEYRFGDRVRWGGNDKGERGLPAVEVLAYPESCRVCGYDEDRAHGLSLEDDVLVAYAALTPETSGPLMREERRRGW